MGNILKGKYFNHLQEKKTKKHYLPAACGAAKIHRNLPFHNFQDYSNQTDGI